MKAKFYFFFIVTVLFTITLQSQEKRNFLQHRFDGYKETITKNDKKEKLDFIKSEFERIGIKFTFSNLKFNKKKEIIRVSFKIKNKKSSSSVTLNDGKPIPNIIIGEINGIVFIKPSDKVKIILKNKKN